jgi:hypothetical protein
MNRERWTAEGGKGGEGVWKERRREGETERGRERELGR